MKKRVLAILLSLALALSLCVAVSATGEDAFATIDDQSIGIIGGEDGDTAVLYGGEDFYLGDDLSESIYTDGAYEPTIEDLEAMMGQFGEENVGILIAAVVVIMICSFLFLPALIVLIVFAVLNSKLKKKIRECEIRISTMQQAPVATPIASPVYPQAEPQPAPQEPQSVTEYTPVDAPVDAPIDAPVDENNEGGEE